jgi:hypothetical protein
VRSTSPDPVTVADSFEPLVLSDRVDAVKSTLAV